MRIMFVFKSENFLVPIGMCAISSIARRDGHSVYLSEMNMEDPMHAIEKIHPDIIAYSSSSGEAKHYLKINKRIKEKYPHIFTIMGGPHSTFYPEVVNDSTLDAICVGEGEEVFADVLVSLENISDFGKNIGEIENIVTKQMPDISVRDLVQDLDSLPFPDYALFYDNTEMGKYPLKGFITSRGCPYACTYCFNTAWRKLYSGCGKIIRKHSVDYVIEDVKRVKEQWSLSCVKFQDDVFSFRADEWLEKFSKEYKKEIDLPFFILTRCDLLNEDMIKLLKYAGCQTISMSIEAGNSDVRFNVLKRKMTDKQIIDAHLLCEKYDIATFTNCILGIPDTTIKEDVESLDLSIKSRVVCGEFPIFYPYPKTELGNYTIEKGYYVPDYDSMHTSCQSISMLNCFTDSEKEIQMNFGMLASVAIVFPRLRNLIVNYAIYWKMNRFFTIAYWIAKNYVLRRYIYHTKTSLRESVRMYLRSLKQEVFRHTFKEK